MKLQLDMFTVTLPEGASCSLEKIRDLDQVAEYAFSFAWDETIAAADGGLRCGLAGSAAGPYV